MLSFLREQGNGELPAQKPDAGAEAAPPEGAEKTKEQEYLTVAAAGKRSLKSTIVLAVLFIIGLLCLGFMIKKSTPQAASAASDPAEQTKIEAAIARLTGVKSEMFSGMDEIVNKFHDFSDVLQVKVGELVKNPFELETLSTSVKEEPHVEIKVPEIDAELAQEQQIRQKARTMKLLSIMQSDDFGKRCMIRDKNGDKILYEGKYINEFKVRQIGDSFVKLEWSPEDGDASSETKADSVEVVLNLSE
jgi:preprotein translocase subunit SecG